MKIKKYTATLKSNQNKAMKNMKLYLKFAGKKFMAKTNSKGKATFKIKKISKKGTYRASIIYKGNNDYKKITKNVKIKIKQKILYENFVLLLELIKFQFLFYFL